MWVANSYSTEVMSWSIFNKRLYAFRVWSSQFSLSISCLDTTNLYAYSKPKYFCPKCYCKYCATSLCCSSLLTQVMFCYRQRLRLEVLVRVLFIFARLSLHIIGLFIPCSPRHWYEVSWYTFKVTDWAKSSYGYTTVRNVFCFPGPWICSTSTFPV